MVPKNVSSLSSKLYFEMGGSPTVKVAQALANSGLGVPMSANELFYSSKHNGLVLYVARLLKSVWKQEIAICTKNPDGVLAFDSNLTIGVLVSVQLNLQSLDRFLKQ